MSFAFTSLVVAVAVLSNCSINVCSMTFFRRWAHRQPVVRNKEWSRLISMDCSESRRLACS